MNILFWHGYLLNGSGSNIFTLNIVEEFMKKNHEVYLFSQEREWKEIKGISRHIVMDSKQEVTDIKKMREKGFVGITPYIGEILPVFVYDDYDGFLVKTFDKLSDKELENYIEYNVKALVKFIETTKIDIIYCNHFAISPYIMKKVYEITKVPYIVIGHGSSLNYIVNKDKRCMEKSYEGFLKCKAVVTQSEYIRSRSIEIYEKKEFFTDPRFQIIPSGVSFDQFNKEIKKEEFDKIIKLKTKKSNGPTKEIYDRSYENMKEIKGLDKCKNKEVIKKIKDLLDKEEGKIEYRDMDRDLDIRVVHDEKGRKNILYIGKLIISKGVQVLLMSLPFVFEKHPETRVTIIGYGKFRPTLEMMLRALRDNNTKVLDLLIEEGEYLESEKNGNLAYISEFWSSLKKKEKLEMYLKLAQKMNLDNIRFIGKLDHDTLPYIIKKNSVVVVPSIFPESFGMVSIEGMSQGLAPVVFNHSGLKEVVPFKDSLVDLDEKVVESFAKKININLENIEGNKGVKEKFIRESNKYSFESVAQLLLDVN